MWGLGITVCVSRPGLLQCRELYCCYACQFLVGPELAECKISLEILCTGLLRAISQAASAVVTENPGTSSNYPVADKNPTGFFVVLYQLGLMNARK